MHWATIRVEGNEVTLKAVVLADVDVVRHAQVVCDVHHRRVHRALEFGLFSLGYPFLYRVHLIAETIGDDFVVFLESVVGVS